MMSQGLETVQHVLEQLGIPATEITADASLLNDLSIDSTELIEIVATIERQAQISLDEKQLKNLHTVAELAAFVDSQLLIKLKEDTFMFHTEHCVTVDAPIDVVYSVLADVEGYANLFPPTQSVTLLEQGPDYQIARLVVDVSGQIQSWTTRRDLDVAQKIIRYRQLQTAPLMEHMGGEWRCFPLREHQTQLVITHDFAPRKAEDGLVLGKYTSEEAQEIVQQAVERNSVADLAAVKQEAERRVRQTSVDN
jgi:acyl carrier protein